MIVKLLLLILGTFLYDNLDEVRVIIHELLCLWSFQWSRSKPQQLYVTAYFQGFCIVISQLWPSVCHKFFNPPARLFTKSHVKVLYRVIGLIERHRARPELFGTSRHSQNRVDENIVEGLSYVKIENLPCFFVIVLFKMIDLFVFL